MVACKNPKSRHYGGSESVFTRVAAGAAQKNLGRKYVLRCNAKLELSPGTHTKRFREKMDRKREVRAEKQKTIAGKRQRLLARFEREKATDAAERREGVTYETGCDLEGIAELVDDPAVEVHFAGTPSIVYVDVETTGVNRLTAEVCQIAGRCEEEEFSSYIIPSKGISQGASAVTHLTVTNGEMFHNGVQVYTTPPRIAWSSFISFLKSQGENVILLAHNGFKYDFPIIFRACRSVSLLKELSSVVKGVADTLPIFKTYLKDKVKEAGLKFSQGNLASLYDITNPDAHNAVGDVRVLQKIVTLSGLKNGAIVNASRPVSWILQNDSRLAAKRGNVASMEALKPTLSSSMISKIAACGLSLQTLQAAYKSGEKSLKMLLKEDIGGKPRVTKQAASVENIIAAVKLSLQPS